MIGLIVSVLALFGIGTGVVGRASKADRAKRLAGKLRTEIARTQLVRRDPLSSPIIKDFEDGIYKTLQHELHVLPGSLQADLNNFYGAAGRWWRQRHEQQPRVQPSASNMVRDFERAERAQRSLLHRLEHYRHLSLRQLCWSREERMEASQ